MFTTIRSIVMHKNQVSRSNVNVHDNEAECRVYFITTVVKHVIKEIYAISRSLKMMTYRDFV
jgi:hypothetical protein